MQYCRLDSSCRENEKWSQNEGGRAAGQEVQFPHSLLRLLCATLVTLEANIPGLEQELTVAQCYLGGPDRTPGSRVFRPVRPDLLDRNVHAIKELYFNENTCDLRASAASFRVEELWPTDNLQK